MGLKGHSFFVLQKPQGAYSGEQALKKETIADTYIPQNKTRLPQHPWYNQDLPKTVRKRYFNKSFYHEIIVLKYLCLPS